MAYRDRSQGFGFVYVDIKELLANRDLLDKSPMYPKIEGAKMVNFNKDPGPEIEKERNKKKN